MSVCNALLQVADTEKKLTKEIELLKAKEKRAADAAEAATAQVQHSFARQTFMQHAQQKPVIFSVRHLNVAAGSRA